MDSSSAPTNTTTILDLNDDCLLDVFQYFEIRELLPLVDVCQRFRQISQSHLACIPFDEWQYRCFTFDLFHKKRKLPLRFNRLFGPLLRSVSMHRNSRIGPQVDSPEYEMNMIQLLNTYCCSETLIGLNLSEWNLTSEVTDAMQPWFQRLERLEIVGCKIDELEKFLKSSPQLKKIKFLNDTSYRIFQLIAAHVPGIEAIAMSVLNQTGDSNIQCLGKLSKLKSLDLRLPHKFADSSSAVLREISGASISLQKLHLFSWRQPTVSLRCADQLIDEISKLKMLKVLRWEGIPNLDRVHIIQLCENLTELSELRLMASTLHLDGYVVLKTQLILEIVRNARKLQSLYCYLEQDLPVHHDHEDRSLEEKCLINAKTYMKMVRMVEQRQEKLHLSVILGSYGYAANIPPELIKYHADTLTLVVSKNRKLFEYNHWKW